MKLQLIPVILGSLVITSVANAGNLNNGLPYHVGNHGNIAPTMPPLPI